MKYEAFLTDYMGTLIYDGFPILVRETEKRYGIPRGSLQDVITKKYWPQWSLGKMNEEEFWKRSAEEVGIRSDTINPKSLTEGIFYFSGNLYSPMMEMSERLGRNGVRTGVITNISPEMLERILRITWYSNGREKSLAETFDAIIPSCDVGVRKPDRRIYETALEKIGKGAADIPPCRAVYADNEDGDLITPAKMGMITVKYPVVSVNESVFEAARKTATMIEQLYQRVPRGGYE